MTEIKWDKWQLELIEHEGSVSARCGRQTGKSTAVGKRAANNMIDFPGCKMLMTAPAQRQSSELFAKMYSWLEVKNQEALQAKGGFKANPKLSYKANMENKRRFEYDNGIYNELPTKTTIILKKDFNKPQSYDNKGSTCVCLPAGKTGVYLRFLSLDFLFIDEAAFVPEMVYDTLRPMLAISAKERGLGWECLLSTPFGKGGFFYNSQMSDDFKTFHISAEKCKRYDKSFLKKERLRMTKAMYAQEYLAEFCDEWRQFFKTDLIRRQMKFIEWNLKTDRGINSRFYLGVDIARYGGDENAFVIVELVEKNLKVVKVITTERVSTTDTIGRVVEIDKIYKFSKIFVDDAGVGGAVTDVLIERLGRRVMGLNNASKRVQIQGEEKKKGILKEDLYSNALMLLETGKLELISDLKLLRSLRSITFEYGAGETKAARNIKIFGEYSHVAEAMVRACWCLKERGLKLYVY